MMKRGWLKAVLVIVLVILLLSGIFVYSEYQKLKAVRNLEVSFVSANVEKLSLTKMTVGFTVNIRNPNKIDVNVGAFTAGVFGNNVLLARLQFEPVKLASGESLQKYFPVELNYFDIGSVVLQAIKNRELVWKIQGEYVLELPFGLKFPYSFEKTYVSK